MPSSDQINQVDTWWYADAGDSEQASQRQIRDNVVRLICVLEQIDQRLQNCDVEDQGRWRTRRNSAIFLLNRAWLTASEKKLEIRVEHLPPAERKSLAMGHSLLEPLHQAIQTTSSELSAELGDDIQQIVKRLYKPHADR